jgi:hypothetical protein
MNWVYVRMSFGYWLLSLSFQLMFHKSSWYEKKLLFVLTWQLIWQKRIAIFQTESSLKEFWFEKAASLFFLYQRHLVWEFRTDWKNRVSTVVCFIPAWVSWVLGGGGEGLVWISIVSIVLTILNFQHVLALHRFSNFLLEIVR